jgi:glycosyltransferase involved in cell wall biosynthesis
VAGADGLLTGVSVVVPLYNEAATVARLLAALAAQTRPPDEAVLVDAGSTDGTAARAAAVPTPFTVRMLRRGRLNPGEARNEGIASAAHEWIALTDGGIRPEPPWLEELLAARGTNADVVFGSYEPVCDTRFRMCAALAYVSPRSATGIRGPVVASLLIRKTAFDAVGRFPSHRAAEDLVFVERLLAGSFQVAYAPRAVVHWETAPSVRSTFRRFALYSAANLAAGRGRFWHLGLARQYVLLLALIGLGYSAGAGAWSGLGLVAALGARALKAGWQKRGQLPFPTFDPGLLAGAAGLLFVVDLATLWGATAWFVRGRPATLER